MKCGKWLISVLSLFSCFVYAEKNVLLVPLGEEKAAIRDYYAFCHLRSNDWRWIPLDKMLHSRDSHLLPYDLSYSPSLKNASIVICKNYPAWIPNWQQKIRNARPAKTYMIMFEPPTVLPEMYSQYMFSLFDKVFTWDDNLVDNKKFIKFYYPEMTSMHEPVVNFSQKKLLTMIVANKRSGHRNELYTERRSVIDFFEHQNGQDFDFYGHGWNKNAYKNYKGTVGEKLWIMRNYRFCICYENMKNVKGYITEKILNSFSAGCVPIYWGASNIKEHIPEGCYILRENFQSMEELYSFIKNMKEEEYNTYIENIKRFLQSPEAKKFTADNLATTIFEQIMKDE